MSDKWAEWSKFVLLSIDKIHAGIETLETNLNTIKTEISLIEERKKSTDKSVKNMEDALKGLQKEFKALDTKQTIQKVKLALLLGAITLIGSSITTAIIIKVIKLI